MDRLAAMEGFVRVIDTGSLSGAAKQLRVGQSTVSKTIAHSRTGLAFDWCRDRHMAHAYGSRSKLLRTC